MQWIKTENVILLGNDDIFNQEYTIFLLAVGTLNTPKFDCSLSNGHDAVHKHTNRQTNKQTYQHAGWTTLAYYDVD